ncbi:universal stress protein [Leifsonia sp. AG29]|uniref:universal stress protein n=1 Tax=Leifsonia sp. AG29 TaxID=2598860 RepID=UPI00131D3F20|nr:universal stress protein [Leifsonia sp. AG29]
MAGMILVGVDGSPHHRAALEWAVDRAVRDGSAVELVFVIERTWSDDPDDPDAALVEAAEALLSRERELAAKRVQEARLRPARSTASRGTAVVSDVRVTVSRRYGHVGAELEAASEDAALLVIGSRSRADTDHGFTGSLAVRVAAAASCPVAVVPHGWSAHGHGIVVGVDGEPSSEAAVAFAADEAAGAGEPLTIVCAGFTANPLLAGFVPELSLADRRSRVVEQAAKPVRAAHPELEVRTRVLEGAPARGLVMAAEEARLLVLGTRNRRGARRLMLGSTGHDVLLNLRTPVVVVR